MKYADAPFVLDRPINRGACQAYVERVLVPEFAPGDVVVLDNLGSYKGREQCPGGLNPLG